MPSKDVKKPSTEDIEAKINEIISDGSGGKQVTKNKSQKDL